MKKVFVCALFILISFSVNAKSVIAELLFFDDFEYVVNRENSPLPGMTNNAFVTQGGWRAAKAENISGRGQGYLSTATSIPGYSGSMPGTNSTYVLRMQTLNVYGGSDFWLQYGGIVANTVPADVWFQFWIYINRHPASGEISAIENRHKFIYPAGPDGWPAWPKWLLSFSARSYNTTNAMPFGDPTTGEAFIVMRDMAGEGAPNYQPAYPDNHWKLGPNAGEVSNAHIPQNEWYLVKIHMDTSDNSSGVMEVWLKTLGGEWRKTTEWIGGATPNFTWSGFGAGGHYGFRMPTTIGWSNRSDGAFYYMDDFAMAITEDSLPVYSYAVPIAPPTGLRIVDQ